MDIYGLLDYILLSYMQMMIVRHRKHTYVPALPITEIALLSNI
jgi:hypothetical protein